MVVYSTYIFSMTIFFYVSELLFMKMERLKYLFVKLNVLKGWARYSDILHQISFLRSRQKAKMAKRELADNEVTGYLHEVSPIKISKANNSYFVGKLQTDTNVFQKMVCFDQTKHSSFHEATAAKTPVKICNVKNVQSREDSSKIDVLVNAKSQMHVVRNLNFQHHLDDSVADDNKTLEEILHIPEKNKVMHFV